MGWFSIFEEEKEEKAQSLANELLDDPAFPFALRAVGIIGLIIGVLFGLFKIITMQ